MFYLKEWIVTKISEFGSFTPVVGVEPKVLPAMVILFGGFWVFCFVICDIIIYTRLASNSTLLPFFFKSSGVTGACYHTQPALWVGRRGGLALKPQLLSNSHSCFSVLCAETRAVSPH